MEVNPTVTLVSFRRPAETGWEKWEGGRGKGRGGGAAGATDRRGPDARRKEGKERKKNCYTNQWKDPPDAAGEASCYYNNPQASAAGAAMR